MNDREKREILKPYQSFNLLPMFDRLKDEPGHERGEKNPIQAIIMLSSPPKAGKTTALLPYLLRTFGAAAGVVHPSEHLYGLMGACGLPETHLTYNQFKALPLGRERLIAAATRMRSADVDVFNKLCMTTAVWRDSPVIIVDNVGFNSEVDFFSTLTENPFLLEIEQPYRSHQFKMEHAAHLESMYLPYAQAVDKGLQWPDDSRGSLVTYFYNNISKQGCLLSHDSEDMIEQLQMRVFSERPLASIASRMVYGNLRQVWRDVVEPGAIRDLFDSQK